MAKNKRNLGDSIKRCRYPERNPTMFGFLLYSHMKDFNISQFAAKVGLSCGFISGIYTGHKPPPLARVEQWARVLKLDSHQRTIFLLVAELEHTPTRIRELAIRHHSDIQEVYRKWRVVVR